MWADCFKIAHMYYIYIYTIRTYIRYEEAKQNHNLEFDSKMLRIFRCRWFLLWLSSSFSYLIAYKVSRTFFLFLLDFFFFFAFLLVQSLMWHIGVNRHTCRCHLNVLLITLCTEYNISVKLTYYVWYIHCCVLPLYCHFVVSPVYNIYHLYMYIPHNIRKTEY